MNNHPLLDLDRKCTAHQVPTVDDILFHAGLQAVWSSGDLGAYDQVVGDFNDHVLEGHNYGRNTLLVASACIERLSFLLMRRRNHDYAPMQAEAYRIAALELLLYTPFDWHSHKHCQEAIKFVGADEYERLKSNGSFALAPPVT